MAFYNGETFIVQVELKDYLGDLLIGGDLSSVVGTIYESDGETVAVPTFSFVYSDERGRCWVGEFDTDGVPYGKYKLKVLVTAKDGSQNWEYSTLTLRP